MSVTILDHALIQHKLTIMRDKNTSTYIFKQNLDEIAKLMAFEVTRNVSLKDKAIETPVCPMVGKEMDQHPKSGMEDGEKSCVYFCGARTANGHR